MAVNTVNLLGSVVQVFHAEISSDFQRTLAQLSSRDIALNLLRDRAIPNGNGARITNENNTPTIQIRSELAEIIEIYFYPVFDQQIP